ncbi:retrovirus-related pol polyprotein from transposon TNT 1-94 [Tanacetum coccineum]
MTDNRKLFSSYKAYNGGNVIFRSNLRGNIIGKCTISNDSLKIDNVEHVDNLRFNLLSIGQICDNKCKLTFSEHDSEITKDGKIIGRGIRKKGLYVMKLGNKPQDKICLATIDENSTLWHRRLGHANMRLIQSLASKELVRNLPKLKFDQYFCDACQIRKQAHARHKAKNIVSTTRFLELLHMDLFGPSAVRSYGGNLYTLVIVDDYSRMDHGREFDNEVQFGEFCNANESLNVTFDETPPPSKTSPLVDDDLDEEEAIKVTEKKNLENDIVDETLEIDEIVNIKESRNHPLENVIGNLNQRTLRLVAQGYNQQEGIDYDETYALVSRLESIRILLAYACALDFKLFQMDVKSAFLNGLINEEVYVAQPPRFIDLEKPDHVYKLKKALYGLKQAPKAWYDRLKAFLIKHEYKMGMIDNTLFTKKKSLNLIIVQIYVDDIIFSSTCQDMCDEFAKIMHDEFPMSMMGELNFFLGLQIKQMEDGIFFNQSKYIKEMLKKFCLEDSKPMKTSISSDTKLTKCEECESVDSTKYRGMIVGNKEKNMELNMEFPTLETSVGKKANEPIGVTHVLVTESLGSFNDATLYNDVSTEAPNTTGLMFNVVNSETTSPNQNGSDRVGNEPDMNKFPSSYANKLSPESFTKANLRKLEVNVPNSDDYDLWLPLASVHEVNDRMKNSLYGYFIGKRLAFPVVE